MEKKIAELVDLFHRKKDNFRQEHAVFRRNSVLSSTDCFCFQGRWRDAISNMPILVVSSLMNCYVCSNFPGLCDIDSLHLTILEFWVANFGKILSRFWNPGAFTKVVYDVFLCRLAVLFLSCDFVSLRSAQDASAPSVNTPNTQSIHICAGSFKVAQCPQWKIICSLLCLQHLEMKMTWFAGMRPRRIGWNQQAYHLNAILKMFTVIMHTYSSEEG